MTVHNAELLLSKPIILLEEMTIEGARSVARILIGTVVAVVSIVGSGMLFFFFSDLLDGSDSLGFLATIAIVIIFFGALFLTVSFVSKIIPWRKKRKVLRILPDGTAELFPVPDTTAIEDLIGKRSRDHQLISRISQYQEHLKFQLGSWQFHTDQDTMRWLTDLTPILSAGSENEPVFNANVGLRFDEKGISIVLSSAEYSPQTYNKAHVLIVKAESTVR
ncbi:MAG: hypothetical protein U1E10_03200 [Bdellovibrionales bacterium]|nr:hypothetical protein [Bdellovibrionales bacterium]